MIADPALDALAEALRAADYTLDPVMARLGAAGRAGLERNSTVPGRAGLGSDGDEQATLIRLWILQDEVPEAAVRAALGPSTEDLAGAGYLAASGDRLRATAVIRPYGAEGATDAAAGTPPPNGASSLEGWICHDPLPSLDGRQQPFGGDFVLGVSPASTTLAQMSIRRPVGRALDLGTGCGVQSLHLATHAERVVATDLNPRALELAYVSTRLSGVVADLRLGSLYEPVADERFDLIVSNPPFVISPPSSERLTYREGTLPGDELVRQVLVDGTRHLAPGGTMQVLCNWAITDADWQERLDGWLAPTGCDAFVVQRERLDPFEYAEMWLADAGLKGTPDYARRYEEYLVYFESLGLVGVGMGWVSLRNAGRDVPDRRFEEWPYEVHQPIGAALAAQQDAVDLAAAGDDELLGARWRVVDGLRQETMGRPGAEDPEHIVLRQHYGLGRAREAGTALAAFVGACDGDLTAGQIVGALASILDADAAALAVELTAELRSLIADGYLRGA